MYRSAYKNLIWGYVIVLLDFRVATLDIMPDFIGYMLVYSALGTLVNQHNYFGKARPFIAGLVILSLFDLFEIPGSNLLENPISMQNIWYLLIGQIHIVIETYAVYWVCKAIYTLADLFNFTDLKESIHFRWNLFLVAAISLVLTAPFTLNISEQLTFVYALFIILSFVSLILILFAVSFADKRFSGQLY